MTGKHETPSKVADFFAIFYSPEFRKFQAVLIGVAVAAATAGLLPAVAATWVLLVVGVLTAAGVYAVPNKQTAFPEVVSATVIKPAEYTGPTS